MWARITADFLKKKWGVPVNVINKTGGGGVPANLEVHQAAPDGYTMLTTRDGGENGHNISILQYVVWPCVEPVDHDNLRDILREVEFFKDLGDGGRSGH